MSSLIKLCANRDIGYHRYLHLCLEHGMNPLDEDHFYDAVEECYQ